VEQDAVDVARQFAEAFAARDLERMVELTHPDLEFIALRSAFEGTYRGKEGVRRWADELFTMAPDYWVTIDELRPVGDDGYVLLGRQGGMARGQRVPFEAPLALVGSVRDGSLYRVEAYATRGDALAAAGSSG